ncbi:MAG TPA: hypothetical protein VD996_14130, partial [Chitinophagaceae bacterium]|nr:hypothetical protein [Chitinophagaceae bacterium]
AQDEPQAEETEKGFKKENLFFGGSLGLGFGSSYTLVNISPQVGYRFNPYFAAGAGVNFIYSSTKFEFYQYRENYSLAGLNVFGRFYPINQVFIQLQPEMNYTWGKRKFYNGAPEDKLDGKFAPSLLAGAGVAIPTGRNGAILLMLQYDVIQHARTPYGTRPFFNVGVNF